MKKQTFLKGSLILGSSALLAKLLGAAFKIPLTNLLGGTGMGYFSCAYGLFLPLYAVLVTGLSTAVAKLTAACAARGDLAGALHVRRTARRSFLVLGLLGSLLAVLAARPFAMLSAKSMEAYPAVLMIAPAVLLSCLTAVERGYHEGLCSMYPTAVSQAAEALVKLLCGLLLCHAVLEAPVLPTWLSGCSREGAAAAAAVLGVTLSTAAGYLCMLLWNRRAVRPSSAEMPSGRRTFRMLLGIMLPAALGALVTNLTSLIDLVTVMRGLGELLAQDAAAFYEKSRLSADIPSEEAAAFVYGSFMGLSVTVFNLVPSLTNMFAKGVLPCTAQAWAAGRKTEASRYAGQALLLTALAAVPAACGMAALPEGVLLFLYPARSAEVAAAAMPLRYLAPGVIFLCLSFPVFSLLQAIGRADLPVKIMLPGVAVKLLLNLTLLPRYALSGAAMATTACYGVIFVLSMHCLRRQLPLERGLGGMLLKTLYAGGMCAAAAWLVYTNAPLGQRGALLLAVLTGAAVYGALLLASMGRELRGIVQSGRSASPLCEA